MKNENKKHSLEQRLRDACTVGDSKKIVELCKNPQCIDIDIIAGQTPLYLAVWRCDNDLVSSLLCLGANPNKEDDLGNTPLHNAAINGNIDIARMLLQALANANSINLEGYSPLHYAAFNGNEDLIELLISFQANPSIRSELGETPIDRAKLFNNQRSESLLKKHATQETKTQSRYMREHRSQGSSDCLP